MPEISVVICTHNPRPEYFRRVLGALKIQTLPLEQWELLLIDNASTEPLAESWDLSWHPHSRHVREPELGLTPARLRGIKESTGEILVFVDDDNVLGAAYLAETIKIEKEWPILGSWGGSLIPEFEVKPEDWTRRYWQSLAIREIHQNYWSNNYEDPSYLPLGAGLCIRSKVAKHYMEATRADPVKIQLGRKGVSLLSTEDIDMVYTGRTFSLGYGVFSSLELVHLMPRQRLEEAYLLRLAKAQSISHILFRNCPAEPAKNSPIRVIRSVVRHLINRVLMSRRDFKFFQARSEGQRDGFAMLAMLTTNPQKSVSLLVDINK